MPTIAEFAEPLQVLFRPKRFKVLYGGRGAGRSWGIARALLLIGTERPIRVLCARELQNSIAESCHKVLSDQIEAMGLSGFYEVQVGKIIGKNGTTFAFEGIRNNTTKIKSYEGVDYCWVEEAVKVSKASWGILIPTIRRKGSEIWMSFNPELETDYTYSRFVKDKRLSRIDSNTMESDQAYVVKMTWRDNPWFADTALQAEMESDRETDYDTYLNVWEGHCVVHLEGAVFAKELRKTKEQNRITLVPWDRETPVDTFWDLGRRDFTSIWFAQRVAMQWRILAYFEDHGHDIHYYLQECQKRAYTYGTFYMPHDAAAHRIGEKRTVKEITQHMGYDVRVLKRPFKKVNPINAARVIFPNCYFDSEECADGIDRLTHYRYKVKDGQFSEEPLHDDNSNAADAFMMIGQSLADENQETKRERIARKLVNVANDWAPQMNLGWMK